VLVQRDGHCSIGELTEMGNWIKTLEAAIGNGVRIEGFGKYENVGPVCFERAVVFRHNDGGLCRERREQMYDMIRCKARDYCNITANFGDMKIRLTLLLRVGGKAFKNQTMVIGVFDKECKKVDECMLKISRPNNLTFCDQASKFLLICICTNLLLLKGFLIYTPNLSYLD